MNYSKLSEQCESCKLKHTCNEKRKVGYMTMKPSITINVNNNIQNSAKDLMKSIQKQIAKSICKFW